MKPRSLRETDAVSNTTRVVKRPGHRFEREGELWAAARCGNVNEALAICWGLIEDFPDILQFRYTSVNLLLSRKDNSTVVRLLHEIVQQHPNEALAWFMLGRIHIGENRFEEASTCFEAASRCRPTDPPGLYAKAEAEIRLKNFAAGEEDLRAAVLAKPDHWEAFTALLLLLTDEARFSELREFAKLSLSASPLAVLPLYLYAIAENASGGEPDWPALVEFCIETHGGDVDKLIDIVNSLWAYGLHEAAIQLTDHVAATEPLTPRAATLRPLLLPMMPNSEEEITSARERYESGLAQLAELSPIIQNPSRELLFGQWQLLFCQARNNKHLFRTTAATMERIFVSADWKAPHCANLPAAIYRIKIGLICLTVMPLLSGILKNLDRSLFQVYYYRPLETDSGLLAKWDDAADFVTLFQSDDLKSAFDAIASHELDILLFTPYDPFGYGLNLARLARVQAVIIEPAWTDGSRNLDYYISWKPAEPRNVSEHYTAACALMQHPPFWCEKDYSKPAPLGREAFDLPQDRRWYLCAQILLKFHPSFDDILQRILERDPEGIVVILRGDASYAHPLRRRLRNKLGGMYERVHFLPSLPGPWAHRLLQIADAVLDCTPLGGMSSSWAAIHVGSPTVTMPADLPFGRWLTALYEHIGVVDLIAGSPEEYVDICFRCANDQAWRQDVIDRIRAKRHLIIEDTLAVRQLEQFFRAALARALDGKRPTHWIEGGFVEDDDQPTGGLPTPHEGHPAVQSSAALFSA